MDKFGCIMNMVATGCFAATYINYKEIKMRMGENICILTITLADQSEYIEPIISKLKDVIECSAKISQSDFPSFNESDIDIRWDW